MKDWLLTLLPIFALTLGSCGGGSADDSDTSTDRVSSPRETVTRALRDCESMALAQTGIEKEQLVQIVQGQATSSHGPAVAERFALLSKFFRLEDECVKEAGLTPKAWQKVHDPGSRWFCGAGDKFSGCVELKDGQ